MDPFQRVAHWLPLLGAVVLLASCVGQEGPVSSTRLTVRSRPVDGATVWVNGRPYGETPQTIEGLRPGLAIVELEKEGCRRTWEEVELKPGEEVEVVIDLKPLLGYLTVRTVPGGASVFLDRTKLLGTTPVIEVPIPIGDHVFQVVHEDYHPEGGDLTVEQDRRYTYAYELKPKPAQLQVFSQPSGGKVWLNFLLQDQVTPAQFELPPGEYTVAIYLPGYITGETTVILDINDQEKLLFDLEEGDAPIGMVLVPAGEFVCGTDNSSPDEAPRRVIHLDAFYIDRYEVTNADFAKVFPDHKYPEGRKFCPVTGVTWHRAVAYAQAVGKRLPTELEWEKAARGVEGREYPWGNEFDPSRCNVGPGSILRKVGEARAGVSPYGCHDMGGNAYEWTASWYDAYPGNKAIKQEYGQLYRTLRGGSYRTGAFDARSARRWYDHMGSAREDYGFRCAKDVERGSSDARR